MSSTSYDQADRNDQPDHTFGVYVHVPFCSKRCDYCAFATWTDRSHLMDAHTSATIEHLRRLRDTEHGSTTATSVFFGGGTPSLLPGTQLSSILRAVVRASTAEVTVECNPDTVSPELFATYIEAGVTRISFGVQSMVDHVLLGLGRTHDPDNVRRGVEWAREAGLTFNLDLIYGGAGESIADWQTTVERVMELEPPHVSAYALTIEAGTPLALDTSRHPDDDDLADKYLLANERFAAVGLSNYEISNWSRPGHECRHNWLYWMQGDYIGVGCAAHSHQQGRRWWNLRTPERYVEAAQAAGDAESFTAAAEVLDTDTRALEQLQLLLRTRFGIPVAALSINDQAELADLLMIDGPGATDGRRIRLTPEGRLLANEVAHRLVLPIG